MSLVSGVDLSLSFLGKDLFHDLHFQIEPGERWGLVGPNGSGKTSLLRLLVGEISPDRGEVRVKKGTHVGYLPQDIYESISGRLLESVLHSVPSRTAAVQEIRSLEESLKKSGDERQKADLAARLAEMHERLTDLETRYPKHTAEKILHGLGFKPQELEMPVSSLSGGWKMRAALASLLYQAPDLLLLDEPTNHLDFFSVRWMEEYLRGYKGAMVIICHDRDFLNRQVNRTMGFEPEGPRVYSGNVDGYLSARGEENRVLEAKARNQEQKVKEAMRFVERFRAKASKARQAQSKIKLVEKLALIETHKKEKSIRFSFPPVGRSGRDVLTLSSVSKRFGEKPLYEHVLLRATRGERIAIIGPNGAGKTTLLRMVAGELAPDAGQVQLGHGVELSYYAQHLSEMLDPRKTVLEEVYQAVPHQSVSFVRGVCGAFLFSGKDVDKPVGVLSGGERARVSLAKILVNPGNFIVMDEPTNHLDLISSERLIDALAEFNGTLIFVSHNLSFVKRLATKIWDIRDGAIVEYPGSLQEYEEHLALADRGDGSGDQAEVDPEDNPLEADRQDADSKKAKRREKAERRSVVSATLKPIQERILRLEERIHEIEGRMKEVEGLLTDPETFKDKQRCVPLLNEYTELKNKLDELMGRWEYNQEELDSARERLEAAE